jgi:hypothetical protein
MFSSAVLQPFWSSLTLTTDAFGRSELPVQPWVGLCCLFDRRVSVVARALRFPPQFLVVHFAVSLLQLDCSRIALAAYLVNFRSAATIFVNGKR